MGKAVGADARKGKATYVTIHGLERARELAAETHARARGLLDQVPGDISDLAALTDLTFARQH
jgi:geranylgeranyl pyrophosphate synthase